jgi:hypothetical protein
MTELEVKKKPRGKPFAKGVSGNPNGRPKKENCLTSIIKEVGDELVEVDVCGEKVKMTYGRALVLSLYNKALSGDVPAAKEILDRTDGKVTQPQDIKHQFTDLTDDELIERAKGLFGGVGTPGAVDD